MNNPLNMSKRLEQIELKNIHLANKNIKRSSKLLDIRDMQTMRKPPNIPQCKNLKVVQYHVLEQMWNNWNAHASGRKVKQYNPVGKQC